MVGWLISLLGLVGWLVGWCFCPSRELFSREEMLPLAIKNPCNLDMLNASGSFYSVECHEKILVACHLVAVELFIPFERMEYASCLSHHMFSQFPQCPQRNFLDNLKHN